MTNNIEIINKLIEDKESLFKYPEYTNINNDLVEFNKIDFRFDIKRITDELISIDFKNIERVISERIDHLVTIYLKNLSKFEYIKLYFIDQCPELIDKLNLINSKKIITNSYLSDLLCKNGIYNSEDNKKKMEIYIDHYQRYNDTTLVTFDSIDIKIDEINITTDETHLSISFNLYHQINNPTGIIVISDNTNKSIISKYIESIRNKNIQYILNDNY